MSNIMSPMSAHESSLPQERRTPCEVWTRVMGYHRPVVAFNPGKQSEHRDRRHFLESACQPAVVTCR